MYISVIEKKLITDLSLSLRTLSTFYINSDFSNMIHKHKIHFFIFSYYEYIEFNCITILSLLIRYIKYIFSFKNIMSTSSSTI